MKRLVDKGRYDFQWKSHGSAKQYKYKPIDWSLLEDVPEEPNDVEWYDGPAETVYNRTKAVKPKIKTKELESVESTYADLLDLDKPFKRSPPFKPSVFSGTSKYWIRVRAMAHEKILAISDKKPVHRKRDYEIGFNYPLKLYGEGDYYDGYPYAPDTPLAIDGKWYDVIDDVIYAPFHSINWNDLGKYFYFKYKRYFNVSWLKTKFKREPDVVMRFPGWKGHCNICGKQIRRKRAKYCKTCAPKAKKFTDRQRRNLQRKQLRSLGFLPLRDKDFNQHVSKIVGHKFSEGANPSDDKLFKDYPRKPVTDLERSSNEDCPLCGCKERIRDKRSLHKVPYEGGKIGHYELLCPRCGYVYSNGLQAYQAPWDNYNPGYNF